jgi:hypothetical protein
MQGANTATFRAMVLTNVNNNYIYINIYISVIQLVYWRLIFLRVFNGIRV